MFTRHHLENILFLDIETASHVADYSQMSERYQALWDKKAKLLNKREEEPRTSEFLYTDRAAIFAEFGRVVCISCGYIKYEGDIPTFRVKSYFGTDEKQILIDFSAMVNAFMS